MNGAEPERSGQKSHVRAERRSQKWALMRDGKTARSAPLRSAPMLWSLLVTQEDKL